MANNSHATAKQFEKDLIAFFKAHPYVTSQPHNPQVYKSYDNTGEKITMQIHTPSPDTEYAKIQLNLNYIK